MTTRPILRTPLTRSSSSSSSSTSSYGPELRVHFPPPPSLASFHPALPASAYDRSAIVVQANPCALPPRNSRFHAVVDPPPKRRPQTPFNHLSSTGEDDSESATDDAEDHSHKSKSVSPPCVPRPPTPASQRTRTTAPPYRIPAQSSYSSMACLDGF